ncbi:MAG: Trk system potassium transporter TrkA [Gammaproteobacteria bacterium]|nr:Trk system potassium transporter TrkA [Gammaproteobacteria bacterium]
MNVLILGAGQVGRTVLKTLSADPNMTITMVDIDGQALEDLGNVHSCNTITGHASSPNVLRKAGIEDADALIAVTASDEVNLIACQVALTLHDTPRRIARIRNINYLKDGHERLFASGGIPVDEPISPELAVVEHLTKLISFQGAHYVTEFADGNLIMTCSQIHPDSHLVDVAAAEVSHVTSNRVDVVGLVRDAKLLPNLGAQTLRANDIAFILGTASDMHARAQGLSGLLKPDRSIVIGGGGNIGMQLAANIQKLKPTRTLKIIEPNEERAAQLGAVLKTGINLDVLHGDATSEDFLRANDVNDSDLYCAVTNNDLANIVSSLSATRLNVKRTLTLVQQVHYLESLANAGLGILISPQQVTANIIQGLVRENTVTAFRHLPTFNLDVIELKVQGNPETSRVVGKLPSQLKLPKGVHWACLVRNAEAVEPAGSGANVELYPILGERAVDLLDGDRAILITENSKATNAVEQLFRAKAIKLF